MPFSIHCRLFGGMDNACIVIADDEAKTLLMFDAPIGCEDFLKEFVGYEVEALLLTHGHYDHILGAAPILKKARHVFAHQGDRTILEHPELMALWLSPEEGRLLKSVKATHWFKARETIELAGLPIEVRETPGHSPGGVVYYIPLLQTAVVGDDVFRGSIGRTDLPGGSHKRLLKSIRNEILTLPDDTRLFPGHGSETTVGHERANNPYLQ